MSINSAAFLLFLTISLSLYYLAPKRRRYLVLLAASAFFYLAYSVQAALYLLITTLTTYAAAGWMDSMHKQEKAALAEEGADRKAIKQQGKSRRKRVLTAILLLNFATLALFKYLPSWLEGLRGLGSVFGVELSFRPLALLLPLGISFYIFQTAGYLIDVYRGRVEAERSILKYALFVSYFPQMIQGPINRFDRLHPQLVEGHEFSADALKYGIELMLWGMLKKVFIADPLAGAVAEIYGNYMAYPGAVVFLGAALYCLQLYCDFSGGTDLVRGVSQMFGIEMEENFRRPYFARTVDEFWRRWHMSLGDWMKDYLFYPLALSGPLTRLSKRLRKHLPAHYAKLFIPCVATVLVFLTVGIWQGPGLANIAYGLWNGGLMSLALLCQDRCRRVKERLGLSEDKKWFRLFQILRTCLLVVIGRYFSRASTLTQALKMLWRTLRCFGLSQLGRSTLVSFGLGWPDWLQLLIAGAVLFAVSLLQERGIPIRKTLEKQSAAIQFLLTFLAVLLLVASVYLNTDYTAIGYVYENI